jgi:hypothetical protein
MSASNTFLAPGQRYIGSTACPWQIDLQLTILAVVQDIAGPAFVTYRGPQGPRITAPAEDLEHALAEGRIIPVTASFTLIAS